MMLHSWWNTNMDAWRWISPLIAVGGLAVVAIGIAASPVSAFGSNYSGAVGPVPTCGNCGAKHLTSRRSWRGSQRLGRRALIDASASQGRGPCQLWA
jgi:hypothetical protein